MSGPWASRLEQRGVDGGGVRRGNPAGGDALVLVGTYLEVIGHLLRHGLEVRRRRLSAVIALPDVGFLDLNRDADFRFVRRKEPDEGRHVLAGVVAAAAGDLRGAGLAGDGVVVEGGLRRRAV